ncbi:MULTISPECIES: hypothetical protein [Oceanobacillus]|uniref:Uncharacterized protein n=2 Tax=Oceanobacillus kimchii TaxID=746691 RepID=A0ABQ5TDS7_9BACI|nr:MULTISPECIES: hypothetical protein [Oceanobacillus]MBT2652828.1 hypothetical protein [Oceanobacillus sp. ISL-73]OEH53575.1 hypothetical protein AQ616_13865 [Oceanobacillus sp. E9]GLO64911.1 hypothetical protein MACH08_06950 [Oceanobacillus kimchii]
MGKNEEVIRQYQEDEKRMVLIFAQWCINHQLDPFAVYGEAYPTQMNNSILKEVIDWTVDASESDPIDTEMIIQILQAYGNDDLAMIVFEKSQEMKQK